MESSCWEKICSCCFRKLAGIPCRHVVAVMHYQNLNPKLYVDSCYMTEIYKLCYENNVSLINGMVMSPNVDVNDMLLPKYKKGQGKPKKSRFGEHGEIGSRIRRLGVAYSCTKYDNFGHNANKCQSKEHDPKASKRNVLIRF